MPPKATLGATRTTCCSIEKTTRTISANSEFVVYTQQNDRASSIEQQLHTSLLSLDGYFSEEITALSVGPIQYASPLLAASNEAIYYWRSLNQMLSDDVKTNGSEILLMQPGVAVQFVTFDPEASMAAVCCGKSVLIFELEHCKMISQLEGHTQSTTTAAFLPGMTQILVTCSEDRTIKVAAVQ
ncbi:hypothetical protein PROFUN_12657 [Planoprotostelium fungivorum]|uniref:Uncharacterized protein n=1 Tax=Planoprotostelium fungivorum TaxID=1890364 RepID=A0A2P6N707_9EUKA|nr:hypothetical protein PROFUN_12657 [Planoprotostelium fungivorum]